MRRPTSKRTRSAITKKCSVFDMPEMCLFSNASIGAKVLARVGCSTIYCSVCVLHATIAMGGASADAFLLVK